MLEIVGVVADIEPITPGAAPEAQIYWSNRQSPRWATFFIVRAASDPTRKIEAIRDRLAQVDPDLSLRGFSTMAQRMERRLVRPRFNLALIGGFAVVALLLASVGLYGVVAYTIAARRHEIGIRLALGAERRRIVREVLQESAVLILIGLSVGAALALATSRLFASLLHGVVATDAGTYLATATLLALVALCASAVPALRASRTDPMIALRHE